MSVDDKNTRFGDPHLLMQIHDELVYEVGYEFDDGNQGEKSALQHIMLDRQKSEFSSLLHRCMETNVVLSLSLNVPITTNIKTGNNWGTLSEKESDWHETNDAEGKDM